jgi:hypothetical protein
MVARGWKGKEMKSRALVAALLLSTLGAAVGLGAEPARATRASASSVATRHEQPRRTVAFGTDRTDSWLCGHVSVFFCDVMPKLTVSGDSQVGKTVPDRSRTHN